MMDRRPDWRGGFPSFLGMDKCNAYDENLGFERRLSGVGDWVGDVETKGGET